MTTTPMKRAGQLIAHLETLHLIRDVRQLLLLQLVVRERQDQAVLFRRQGETVTLSLIGAQLSPHSETLQHRAGSVSAAALFTQLQALSGIAGDDVAFSSGQITGLVDEETLRIEQSDGLARLDAALLGLVSKLETQPGLPQTLPEQGTPDGEAASSGEDAEPATGPAELRSDLSANAGETPADEPFSEPEQEAEAPEQDNPELVSGLPSGRSARRRA